LAPASKLMQTKNRQIVTGAMGKEENSIAPPVMKEKKTAKVSLVFSLIKFARIGRSNPESVNRYMKTWFNIKGRGLVEKRRRPVRHRSQLEDIGNVKLQRKKRVELSKAPTTTPENSKRPGQIKRVGVLGRPIGKTVLQLTKLAGKGGRYSGQRGRT